MKRVALIVECSDVPGQQHLPGAKADANRYREFLQSPGGGQWFANEIITLNTPTISEIRATLSKIGRIDYAFVGYSGHGLHSKELDDTKAILRDGQIVVRELIPITARATLVVDACRNIVSELTLESRSVTKYAMAINASASYRNYRAEFDLRVSKAESGISYVFSCDLNESAQESKSGGYFTQSLISAGESFSSTNFSAEKFMPINLAFNNAAEIVKKRTNNTQNPQYQGGRRLSHFPFSL